VLAVLAAANHRRTRMLALTTALLALALVAVLTAWFLRRPGNAPELRVGRDYDAADGRFLLLCAITGWAASGVCR
jgi:heme A synthase